MNHFIVQGLIILILINLISSSSIIKSSFPTIGNNSNSITNQQQPDNNANSDSATTKESKVEEGVYPGKDARSKETETPPSLLGNNSYNALPASIFLKYYINQTKLQINGLICLEILQEPSKPENIVNIPCERILVFIADKDLKKNYSMPNFPDINRFYYKNDSPYKLILLSQFITKLDSKDTFNYCGKIKELVSLRTDIISCKNIGILIK